MALEYFDWEVGDVFVLHLQGPITLGQGTQKLRELINDTVASGRKKILLNMAEVYYIDSSGLGTLVGLYTSARNAGGEIKLAALTARVKDVLQITKLGSIFDFHDTPEQAAASFGGTMVMKQAG